MERRNQERRQMTRGYGPDRRTQVLPVAGLDRRHDQRRIKDRRQVERRRADLPTLYSLDESIFNNL
ncbi:MAG: hypothetical protein LLH30_00440 [Candidatus Manganitrophus sp. SA1]|nr:hypothetical protein [Candidatus Manganitrophus morganii]